ncbi:MAG TPA: D-Ala-D-Ala carboxypeptidase family metallohydrolase, partial [Gemmatimonadaceae bacterium]|nr:D-Ala-D-Ala carboxypeptidase family metallohydrolase [Gemmatimonadaceae bacterium]
AGPAIGDSTLSRAVGGRSGALRALFVAPSAAPRFEISALAKLFGDSTTRSPGVYTVDDTTSKQRFSLISLLPFSAKRAGRIGTYRVGHWPGERRGVAKEQPEGFIEVTPANQDTHVSENFRLRDFLTHDQQGVWPKYLVLREELVEKLELALSELRALGIQNPKLVIMSGFRTPQYNARGLRRGRAPDSRHQYGDAADVFVDSDGNGRMDDLNGDKRVNKADATVLAKVFERIEQQFPDLAGGVAVYKATRAHGPFVHVDVRGERARWASN